MEGAAEAGLEVAQQGVVRAQLRQIVGVLAAGDNRLVVTVGGWSHPGSSPPLSRSPQGGGSSAYRSASPPSMDLKA
jgi:hypothetical protein